MKLYSPEELGVLFDAMRQRDMAELKRTNDLLKELIAGCDKALHYIPEKPR
jgi:hypothetical protein